MKYVGLTVFFVLCFVFLGSCIASEKQKEIAQHKVEISDEITQTVKSDDLVGLWFSINEIGVYDMSSSINIIRDVDQDYEYKLEVNGDFIFPGSKIIVGYIKKDLSDMSGYKGVLSGVYPDGKENFINVHLSVVDFSAVDNVTGAISLCDVDTPEWIDLGMFQKKTIP